MEVFIVYGAHKTATTFFQKTLEINSQELLKNNVLFIPLEELREKFTNTIFKEENWVRELKTKNFIKGIKDLNKIQRLIIFDENFCGPIFKGIKKEIYPELNKNIYNINNYFSEFGIVKNILIIRNYFDYFVSRYSEYLRQYDVNISLEKYVNFEFDSSWFIYNKIDNYLIFEEIIKNNETFLDFLTGIKLDYNKLETDSYIFRRKYLFEETQVLLNLSTLKYGKLRNHIIDLFDGVDENNGTDIKEIYKDFYKSLSIKYEKDLKNSKKILSLKK